MKHEFLTANLNIRLTVAYQTVKDLTVELDGIEADTKTPAIERLSQIKKIRAKLDKVGAEIDNIKKSIKLLVEHSIN